MDLKEKFEGYTCPKCVECQECKPECGLIEKLTWSAGGFAIGVTGAIIFSVLKH